MINQSAEGSATTTHRALRTRIVIIPVESPSRIFSGLEPQIRNVDVARRDDVTLGIVDIVACSVDWTVEPTILSIGRPGRQQQKHNEGRHDLNYPPPRHLGQIADKQAHSRVGSLSAGRAALHGSTMTSPGLIFLRPETNASCTSPQVSNIVSLERRVVASKAEGGPNLHRWHLPLFEQSLTSGLCNCSLRAYCLSTIKALTGSLGLVQPTPTRSFSTTRPTYPCI